MLGICRVIDNLLLLTASLPCVHCTAGLTIQVTRNGCSRCKRNVGNNNM